MTKFISHTVLTLTIIFSLFILAQKSEAQCHIDDWTALKAFYENSNIGDVAPYLYWQEGSGWDATFENRESPISGCDLNSLKGVLTNDVGRVISFYISLLNPKPPIGIPPPPLPFTAKLPAEIGLLSELEVLSLPKLTGNIPVEIANLTKLRGLTLNAPESNTNFIESLKNLNHLTFLSLTNIIINGNIPAVISDLSNLEVLSLVGCYLTGAIPQSIGNLNNLIFLNLSINQLSGNIPESIGSLRQLKQLNLSYNYYLSGTIPKSLGNLLELDLLLLNTNSLIGDIPAELGNLLKLKVLDLRFNNLSGCFAPNLANFCRIDFQVDNSYSPDAIWANFCETGAGVCATGETNLFGCRDPNACNYDTEAAYTNNFICEYPIINCNCSNINGCTDFNAINYNPNADCNDGTCEYKNTLAPGEYYINPPYRYLETILENTCNTSFFEVLENTTDSEISFDDNGRLVVDFDDNSNGIIKIIANGENGCLETWTFNLSLNNCDDNTILNFSWLSHLIDKKNCYDFQVDAYRLKTISDVINPPNSLYVRYGNTGALYDFEGQLICSDFVNDTISNCLSNYEIFKNVWSCNSRGCTDQLACNYDPDASCENGSCCYENDNLNEEIDNSNTNMDGAENSEIFSTYPWLNTLVDTTTCNGEYISVYDAGSSNFILIQHANAGKLYLDSGIFYCDQTPSYSCVAAYSLTNITETWTCRINPCDNICSSQISNIVCPNNNNSTNVCAPVTTAPLTIGDFVPPNDEDNLNELLMEVEELVEVQKYFTTTIYNYTITENTSGNKTYCQTVNHVANQFLPAPNVAQPSAICEGDLWSSIKMGVDQYKIYADDNGAIGEELSTCSTSSLICPTTDLGVDTNVPNQYNFWATTYFEFPDGTICESEPTPFFIDVQPKPVAVLSTQNKTVSIGESISLVDLINTNTSGYWTGENVLYLLTATGENIAYFSTNEAGVYKLYYTVNNQYCERSYLLVVEVSGEEDPVGNLPVYGCTSSNAVNYNSNAIIEDGSCEYEPSRDCGNYTGAFFYADCGGVEYYFIRLSDTKVFDPYFAPSIGFTPIEGQQINFDFEIKTDVTTPCALSISPITITCFQTLAVGNVFNNHDWLDALVNRDNCTNEKVTVYDAGDYNFVQVETSNGSSLYYQDGTFYCEDAPGYSCVAAYNLSTVVSSWQCGDLITVMDEIQQPPIPDGFCGLENPFDLDWLNLADLETDGSSLCNVLTSVYYFRAEINGSLTEVFQFNSGPTIGCNISDTQRVDFRSCSGSLICFAYLFGMANGTLCSNLYTQNSNKTLIWDRNFNIIEAIFRDYPWVNQKVDKDNCSNERITAYETAAFKYVYIQSNNVGDLYYYNGAPFCTDASDFSCINQLDSPIKIDEWTCDQGFNLTKTSNQSKLSKIAATDHSTFNLYPNPAKETVIIDLQLNHNEAGEITIFDISGNAIETIDFDGSGDQSILKIATNHLPKGMYMVQLQTTNISKIQKLMIE